MKTLVKTLAGGIAGSMIASGAAAATFDFTFYEDTGISHCGGEVLCAPEDYTPVDGGSGGELSYDGTAEPGVFPDLDGFGFSFNIGGAMFSNSDTIFSFGEPALNVFDLGDDALRALFTTVLRVREVEGVELQLQASEVLQVRPGYCFGEISILNDEGDCLNLGFGSTITRVSEDEEPNLGYFSVIRGFDDDLGPQENLVDNIFGRYIGREVRDDTAAVPLPASLPLLALALGGMGYVRSRRT